MRAFDSLLFIAKDGNPAFGAKALQQSLKSLNPVVDSSYASLHAPMVGICEQSVRESIASLVWRSVGL